ncbi:MAG: hypothetical protein AB7I79_24110 [Rhizobiaceae bacterium]
MKLDFSVEAAVLSFVFLCIGIIVAWLSGKYIKPVEGTAVLALLLLPFVGYLVFSGKIESIKGGGIEWKLKAEASAPALKSAIEGEISTNDLARRIVAAEDVSLLATFGIPHEVVIVKAPLWSPLNHPQRLSGVLKVGELIYVSLLAGKFKALIVVDDNDRPIGLFEREFFLDLLRIPFLLYVVEGSEISDVATPATLRQMIQQTELWTILRHPAERAMNEGSKAFLPTITARLEALKIMSVQEWNAAALTDVQGIYSGTLWRESLSTNLFLTAMGATIDESQ